MGIDTGQESFDGLVGTWRLTECIITHPDGRLDLPYGPAPKGAILYTSDGWMAAHLHGPHPQATETQERYSSYYGPFSIDREAQIVTHHVCGASEALMLAEQRRHYRIEGNRLHLEATMNGLKAALIWERP